MILLSPVTVFIIGIAYVAFQLYTLFVLFSNPKETPSTKFFWFAVIFALPFLGSFIYLFKTVAEKRRSNKFVTTTN